MTTPRSSCSICERSFEVRFRYQSQQEADGNFSYFCSQMCQQRAMEAPERCVCNVCSRSFDLEFPFQVTVDDGGRRYFCSTGCRQVAPALRPTKPAARRIAIFNHKGGTGKTTTAINLAAGLADSGRRVLLVDADGQGNVGASLGIRGERNLYHVLVQGLDAGEAVVPVRHNLDVLTSNETLAAAELYLAGRPNRDRVLRERMGDRVQGYEMIVIDCAPALSLMNQNVLMYADSVIVPVSCDYLSLVGVKQVLRTLRNVRDLLDHRVEILGVLPTFYDQRNKICREAVDALREHFGERCLPPIRVNTRLREAPSKKQTIFEFAPSSNGAADYRTLVHHVRGLQTRSAPPPAPAIRISAPSPQPRVSAVELSP